MLPSPNGAGSRRPSTHTRDRASTLARRQRPCSTHGMAPLWYRMRSWVRGQWRAPCAVAVVVAIASGAVVTLLAGAVRTITAPDRYSSWRGRVYDVSIQQSHGPPRRAELETLP